MLSTYQQMSAQQLAQISCMNGEQICSGFLPANQAHIRMTAPPPVPLPFNATMTYTWFIDHPNGSWLWHGNVIDRMVPIPFTGDYSIQLLVKYVRKNQNRAFAAYLSNKIVIKGVACE